MNSSTLIGTGVVGASLITNNTVDDAGNIKKATRNEYIATTVATTATVIVGQCINDATIREVHNKYSRSYVESLSDEELERALQQMDLLAVNNNTEESVKTL